MSETYYLTVCSLGVNPNLEVCVGELLKIKESTDLDVEVLLVINQEKIEQTFDSRVKIHFEPTRGYSNVRNKAVSVVPKNTNIIFLDDDEIPTRSWFQALVSANRRHNFDVIFGPVYPLMEMERNSYRSRASKKYKYLQDGAIVREAPTANMLIPKHLLDKKLIYFDPIFNKSGSEDTDLCFRLRNLGVRIRFAKDAVLCENEKPERFDTEYLNARQKKDIANYSLVIRRNSNNGKILWRFVTLLARVFFFTTVSLVGNRYKKNREAYLTSIQVLFTGKPIDD